jgi:hypothetical protein
MAASTEGNVTRRGRAFRLGIAGTLILLAACGTPARDRPAGPLAIGGPIRTDRPTASAPSQSAAPSVAPTATPAPSRTPGPTGQPTQSCAESAVGSGSVSQAQIVSVRVGTHEAYDRVVFEFSGRLGPAGVPPFEIERAVPPFYQDPSGLPMTVAGDPVLRITLRGGTKVSPEGEMTYTGSRDFSLTFPILRQLKESGDFEAVSTWYAGLNDASCVRAYVLANPARLVIDFSRP